MKTMIGMMVAALALASAAQAGELPNQCYQDAMGYANNKVSALSENITQVSRIGEESSTDISDSGMAKVSVELEATYSNGSTQDYRVIVPVQVDDENGCSVVGQASIRKLK